MDQDIIEKKPASPIATSLLVMSAFCLLAGAGFAAWEVRELKGPADSPADHAAELDRAMKKSAAINGWRSAVKEAYDSHDLEGVKIDYEEEEDPPEEDEADSSPDEETEDG